MAQHTQIRFVRPPFSKSVIGLALTFFVLWIGSIQGAPLHEITPKFLVLSLDSVIERNAVWTFFTYAFVHDNFFGALFSALLVWMFGAELQRNWSARRWWGMQLAAVLLGGILCFVGLSALGSAAPVRGYHAPVMALIFSFCWQHWHSMLSLLVFPMTGRTMLLVFLGITVVFAIIGGAWTNLILDLSGLAAGYVASTRTFHPRDISTRFRLWRARRKLSLVRSPDDKPNGKKKSNGIHYN